jgi:tetratricopeptide (TPR) repeat protein
MGDAKAEKQKGDDKKKEADKDEAQFQKDLAANGKKDDDVIDESELVEKEYEEAGLHYKRAARASAAAGNHAAAAQEYDAAGDAYESAAKINIAMGEVKEAKALLQKALNLYKKSSKEYDLDNDAPSKAAEDKKIKDFKDTTYKKYL